MALLTDFSPSAVKAAAQEVFDMIKSGQIAFDAAGYAEVKLYSHTVSLAVCGKGSPSIRVIDANGRHWFPEVEGL